LKSKVGFELKSSDLRTCFELKEKNKTLVDKKGENGGRTVTRKENQKPGRGLLNGRAGGRTGRRIKERRWGLLQMIGLQKKWMSSGKQTYAHRKKCFFGDSRKGKGREKKIGGDTIRKLQNGKTGPRKKKSQKKWQGRCNYTNPIAGALKVTGRGWERTGTQKRPRKKRKHDGGEKTT